MIIFLLPYQAHADLRNGLVGWWKFDEASGNAIDSSSQGNTGTPTGTTVVSNCKRSGCRSFNGTTDYIDLGNTITSTGNFSVSFWFKADSISNTQAGVYFCSSITDCMDVGFYTSRLWVSYANSNNQGKKSNVLLSNVWYHAVVVKGASIINSVYINGVDQTNVAFETWIPNTTTSRIGGTPQAGVNSFGGGIDDVRVYNRVLSAQEVYDLYIPGVMIRNAVIRNSKINQ